MYVIIFSHLSSECWFMVWEMSDYILGVLFSHEVGWLFMEVVI